MTEPDPLIDRLAGAILDGTAIDWSDPGIDDSPRQGLIEELRLLAALAEVHRSPPAESAARPAMDLAAAPAWGHLRLLERIGSGSFGDVYRAWDTRLDREVALKLMPVAGGENDSGSIIREGQLLSRVRHPGVVTIYDAQQIGDRIGLWMEFVRGRTLEQKLEEDGPCSPREAIEIGVALCAALSAVHGAGLLHRDVKTQNVVRSDDGRLVLMDFGTGRELTDESVGDLTGTPLYLGPELFHGRPATIRSDIYSLGVLLFRVLTGAYPVQARRVSELRLAHEQRRTRPIRDERPEVPAGLAAIVDRALEIAPERRYATTSAMAHDLEALQPGTAARRKLSGLAAAAILIGGVWVMSSGAFLSERAGTGRAAALDRRDWLLVGAFSGSTGDIDLEDTLRHAVTSELEQSPHLNVFSTASLRETLERMERPPNARIDETLGREICAREGLRALITGSVDGMDGVFVVGLRAIDAASGRVIVSTPSAKGPTREEALQLALVMGRRMRELLGETSSSIQATSPPLEPVTSQSFEAVRHFTLGKQVYDEERPAEALPHFLDAVRLDPDFAMAHEYVALTYGYFGQTERQREYFERAVALALDSRAPVGQIERDKILADYHTYYERFEQAAGYQRALLTLRPADGRMMANLGLSYGAMREHKRSVEMLEAAWRAYPHPRVRWMLADMYSATGEPLKAAALVGQYLEQPFDWIAYAKHLLIAGQVDEARGALDQAERSFHQAPTASWADLALAQADFHRTEGRFRNAEIALRQGLDRGGRQGLDRLLLAKASLLLDWGRRKEAAASLRDLRIGLPRNRIVHGVLAARAGDLATAQGILERLIEEAAERQALRPEARVHQLRAEIALARRDYRAAHASAAQAVRTFATPFTLTTLARAQEAAGLIAEAAATWTTIVQRAAERTIDWDAPAYSQTVLARLHLARLLEQLGRADEARARYDELLRFWERADPDLDFVDLARARRVRLGQGAHSTPSGLVPKPAA